MKPSFCIAVFVKHEASVYCETDDYKAMRDSHLIIEILLARGADLHLQYPSEANDPLLNERIFSFCQIHYRSKGDTNYYSQKVKQDMNQLVGMTALEIAFNFPISNELHQSLSKFAKTQQSKKKSP